MRLFGAAAGHRVGLIRDPAAQEGDVFRIVIGPEDEEAVETVLLVVLMAVVPPVAAFGLYFGAWHALRHTARLLALPGPRGVPLPVGASVRRYLIHALPPTAVVLVALLALVAEGNESLLVSAVLVLLALTFPHMRTVAALDRSQHTERQSEVRR